MLKMIARHTLLLLALVATLALGACGGGLCVEDDKGEQICTVLDENGDEVGSAEQAMTKAELAALLAKDRTLPKP